MATIPKSFNVETAVEDFSAPGREVKREIRKGFADHSLDRHIWVTVGNWIFSATWSFGTYSTGARGGTFGPSEPEEVWADSPDAEVAFWPAAGGEMVEIDDEPVIGWIKPAAFVAALEAAERDDIAGIRAALTRGRAAA